MSLVLHKLHSRIGWEKAATIEMFTFIISPNNNLDVIAFKHSAVLKREVRR